MKRYPELGIPAHMEETCILNSLILDLKKQKLGYEHSLITMERLNEASKALSKIQECRKKGLYK